MVDRTLAHQSFGLSGRALCLALFSKYVGLMIYGISAIVVEIPTFVIVGSSYFAVGWAAIVAVLALLAAIGVGRTWFVGRYRLEKWTTALFIMVFSGYSYALISRSVSTNDLDSLPLALVPIIVCILPAIRYYDLVGHRFFARKKGEKS